MPLSPFIVRFDRKRKVRRMLPPATVIPVDNDKLDIESDLQCGVCLGVPKKTTTVMDCLHRFCADCIEKALRFGSKKECPTCRGHCPSRRSLRSDALFDELVGWFFPDLEAVEQKMEADIKAMLESDSHKQFMQSQEAARAKQLEMQLMSRPLSKPVAFRTCGK
jgi:hypothetical protein